MRVIKLVPETIVDGVGLRMSVYFSGCHHQCPGCHNPSSWNQEQGRLVDTKEIVDLYKNNKLLSGITLTGGDPFYDAIDLLSFLKELRHALPTVNIWAYTGYTYEDLLIDSVKRDCLNYIDVLVDGPYIESLQGPNLMFKGSSNQRIIALKNVDLKGLSFN